MRTRSRKNRDSPFPRSDRNMSQGEHTPRPSMTTKHSRRRVVEGKVSQRKVVTHTLGSLTINASSAWRVEIVVLQPLCPHWPLVLGDRARERHPIFVILRSYRALQAADVKALNGVELVFPRTTGCPKML